MSKKKLDLNLLIKIDKKYFNKFFIRLRICYIYRNLIQTLIKDLGTVVNNLETAFSSHIVHVTT